MGSAEHTIRELCENAAADILRRHVTESVPRPAFGLLDLDTMVGHLLPGRTVVVTSPPSLVRTCLMWRTAFATAESGLRVLLVLDDPEQFAGADIALASRSRVSLTRLRAARISAYDHAQVDRAIKRLPDSLTVRHGATLDPLSAVERTDDFDLTIVETDRAFSPRPSGEPLERLVELLLMCRTPVVISALSWERPDIRPCPPESRYLWDIADSVVWLEDSATTSSAGWCEVVAVLLASRTTSQSQTRLLFHASTATLGNAVA